MPTTPNSNFPKSPEMPPQGSDQLSRESFGVTDEVTASSSFSSSQETFTQKPKNAETSSGNAAATDSEELPFSHTALAAENTDASTSKNNNDASASENSDTQENDVLGDVKQFSRKAGAAALSSAQATSKNFTQGFLALKKVYQANKEHVEARRVLDQLKEEIDTDQTQLEHRVYVASHFDELVSEKTQLIEERKTVLSKLKEEETSAKSQLNNLKQELDELQAEHKRALRPYKELSEMSQKRAQQKDRILRSQESLCQEAERRVRAAQEQREINSAQTRLYTQQKNLRLAKAEAVKAQVDYEKAQSDLDKANEQARTEEAAQEEKITLMQRQLEKLADQQHKAQSEKEQAEADLAEAHEIHASPEKTELLRQKITDTCSAMEKQSREVEYLAQKEQLLREKTRKERYIFIGISVVALIVVILIVSLLFKFI